MSSLLKVAIAVHPRVWRERYGAEVRGTLLDVADEKDGRVPLSETVPLAFRGLWLRVRGSLAFWGALAILALLIAASVLADPFELDGSITAYAITLNTGLGYALVVLGVLGGWAGARARARHIADRGARLRRLGGDSWPLVAVTVLGYSVAFVILCVRFGTPWPAWPAPLVMLGQAAAVLAAIAIGELLGAVLPRVLVILAAPAAVAYFLVSIARWGFYPGIAYVTEVRPFLGVYVVAGALVAALMLSVTFRTLWLRVPVVALAGVALIATMATWPATELTHLVNPVPRSTADLVCSTAEPVVCLWPEQEAAFGAAHRGAMATAYATAVELGLPVGDAAPRSVARYSMTGISTREGIAATAGEMGLGVSGLRPGDPNLYALSIPFDYWREPVNGDGQYVELTHSIALLLGVPADETWAVMVDPHTGTRLLAPSDAPDEAEARALVTKWLTDGLDGVRSPS